jgi:hypothetical protein
MSSMDFVILAILMQSQIFSRFDHVQNSIAVALAISLSTLFAKVIARQLRGIVRMSMELAFLRKTLTVS